MATDIVPALLEKIQTAFGAALAADPRYRRIANRIRDGTATLEDVHAVSVILGETLSGVLLELFTPEAMPGGVYYWNIVERVLGGMLRGNYDLINEAAGQVQRILNEADGIGLNPVIAAYPRERARGLIEKVVEDTQNPTRWLGEPVVNISESFSDDYMETNARASAAAGLEAKIVRKLGSFEVRQSKKRTYEIPCDWCQSLAGVYVYDGDQPPEIFQRHESCRCSIIFERGRLRQDTQTKRWYTDTGQGLANVRDTAPFRRTPAEAREFDQALEQEQKRIERARRARLIDDYARTENVSHRRAANRITRAEKM